jgi:HK97 family phage portal protein
MALDLKGSPQTDFFGGFSGFLNFLGRGWWPAPSRDAVAPFHRAYTETGKTVTVPNSLELAAVWACVRLISETIATLPLTIYRSEKSGKATPATDHPLYSVLAAQPNYNMTAVEFLEMNGAGLNLWGNSYSVKRKVGKRIVALDPLRPEFMTVYRTPEGDVRYAFLRGIEQEDYAAEEILHVKGFGIDGLVGLSPIGMARQTIGRSLAADESSSRVFQGGLSAGGFIKYGQSLKKEQREDIRGSIEQFTGSKNTGKVMVLENGMDYVGITMKPADAQLLESRNFNVEEVCRWFRVPPVLIGHTDKASSWASSLENTNLFFLTYALRPYLARIEQACNKALLLPEEKGKYFTSFNFDALMRADSAGRAALYASASQNGWMDRNEIRAKENLAHREGADVLTVQSNLLPIDMVGKVKPTPTPEAKP